MAFVVWATTEVLGVLALNVMVILIKGKPA